MSTDDPIDRLFGGMAKLGPGSDADTLHVLSRLPEQSFSHVVDAGCGTGRQTLAIARELGSIVQAIDVHEPFLDELARRARNAGVDHLVRTHRMDMRDIPTAFRDIDLLWSEGSAYNIGFATALSTWAPAIRAGGFLVVSELVWLRDDVPPAVREYFALGYPEMRSVPRIVSCAESSGYEVLATHTLPANAWIEGYYDVLEPRAQALAEDHSPPVRDLAAETLEEIGIFKISEGSYGYVFFALQRNPP